jgi:hypothetical protein
VLKKDSFKELSEFQSSKLTNMPSLKKIAVMNYKVFDKISRIITLLFLKLS